MIVISFIAKPLSLGMLRSDLMLDSGTCTAGTYCCFHQVEINTIASGLLTNKLIYPFAFYTGQTRNWMLPITTSGRQ